MSGRVDLCMQYRVTVNGKVFNVAVELVKEGDQGVVAPAVVPVVAVPIAPAPVVMPTAPSVTGDEQVLSPFPGNIISVLVADGQSIVAGQPLVILEAMKMENEIVAPRNGVVKQMLVSKGTSVNTDDVLVVLG